MNPNRSLLWLSLALLAPKLAMAAESPTVQLTFETNHPALSQALVDVLVPPTRPQELVAATAQQVFRFEASRTNWESIYAAPAAARVLGVSGYAKASSALYVVHSQGVARTRDAGGSWLESVPPDYPGAPAAYVGISVHPTNRREAAIVFQTQAWQTRDFGESFNHLAPSLANEKLLGVAYAGSDGNALVLLTERALHLTSNAGESWITLPREKPGRAALAASLRYPSAAVVTDQGALLAYDLTRPGFRQVHQIQAFGACETLNTDCGGRGLLWSVGGRELQLLGILGDTAEKLAGRVFDEPIRVLRPHPRVPDQALLAIAGQVLCIRVEDTPAAEVATNLWDFASFRPGPTEELKPSATTSSSGLPSVDVQELLNALAATEPPLDELVAASLEHARYSDKDITRWKQRVKARNWLPQLRVGGGFREYTQDQSEIYSYVDRYGIPHRDDLRLTDTIEPMSFFSASLVWNLPFLVFDREEVNINREKRYEMSQRNALITQVTTLYYERLELLLRSRVRADRMPVEERMSTAIKLRQKTELLNQLCGRPLLPLPSSSAATPRDAAAAGSTSAVQSDEPIARPARDAE